MTRLGPLVAEMRAAAPRAFAGAAILAALVPLAGMALLGLSGWFIAASAAAGLAGLGLTFDFLRPSGFIRFLTMGRSGARYGERLVGHDATLRALEKLRLRLFAALAAAPLRRLVRLHAAEALNRLTSDVEAVEGVLIRLAFPMLATLATLLAGGGVLWLLAGWQAAGIATACHAAAVVLLVALAVRRTRTAAFRHEAAVQALRARSIETLTLRAELLMQGSMPRRLAGIENAIGRADAARGDQDQAERAAMLVLSLAPALAIGGLLLAARDLSAPLLLMSVLLALAMAEAPRLMWRGLAELGRIQLAARRLDKVAPPAAATPVAAAPAVAEGPVLSLEQLAVARPGGSAALFAPLDLRLDKGRSVAITAPSGFGKTSLLNVLAGLEAPLGGNILLLGHPLADWPEAELRRRVTLVTQRPALIGGSIEDNLRLAAPDASADEMRDALARAALWDTLAPRGGLAAVLGERGLGLSGGEARRLALARAILRRPALLLADEPTEGMDRATAAKVLAGLRAALPETAMFIVSHRAEDLLGLGPIVRLQPCDH